MASPMQVNARHGDESEAAHRSRRSMWIWAAVAAVLLVAIIAVMARAPTGPGANTGRVSADTADVRGGTAPGVASTYAGQPGGRADGTPVPGTNAAGSASATAQ